jgi:branched-chain amino acid transport system permease protein
LAVTDAKSADPLREEARARAADYLVRRHNFRWPEALPWLVAVAVIFLFPNRLTFGSQVLIMIMFALSLDLILGYAGIVTLGHAAFFGIGAYTVALASLRLGWSEPISGIVAAGIVAGAVGALVGWFILRYRGLTLLMLTIAVAAMLQEAGNLRSDVTGGYDGLPGLMFDPLLGRFQYDLYGHTNYVYVLAALAVVFYVVRRIVFSPFGQSLTGVRENVRRMHAIGAPVHRRLVAVYAISAVIAGLAGGLFTQTNAYVTLTVFDFDISAKVMVMLILGGTGRLYGAFLGGAVYMFIEDYFSKLSPTFWQLGIGLLLVLAVLFARRGLIGLAGDARALFTRKTEMRTGLRRLVWKQEYWKELGFSALDGATVGFIVGFAVSMKNAQFLMSSFVTGVPARASIFVLGGAAIGAGINAAYLLATSREAVTERTS